MLSKKINKSKTLAVTKNSTRMSFRQPTLVYSRNVSSKPKVLDIKLKLPPNTQLAADWMFFMNELNTKMLDKIYI
jgi:hypothetical protein